MFKRKSKKENSDFSIFDVIFGKKEENYVYAFYEAHAIDLIARTIASREIQIFEKNKEDIVPRKNSLYWALNVKSNPNESGTKFIYKLICKLLLEQKALVIINRLPKNRFYLYVADDYIEDGKILNDKTFSNIDISDEEGNTIKLKKTYSSEDAIYFSIKNSNLTNSSIALKEKTGKILKAAQKGFIQSNIPKWRLSNRGLQPKIKDIDTGEDMDYTAYKHKLTEGLTSEDETIVLLAETFGLDNLNEKVTRNSSDLENAFKRIGDCVANKWNIPLEVFYLDQTEKSVAINNWITLGLNYYFQVLEDGFNSKLVGIDDFEKGEYIKINRLTINHKDILDSANGIDKLTADGFSRNEINSFLDLPYINAPWANEHNLTKNYGKYKQEGGERNNGK